MQLWGTSSLASFFRPAGCHLVSSFFKRHPAPVLCTVYQAFLIACFYCESEPQKYYHPGRNINLDLDEVICCTRCPWSRWGLKNVCRLSRKLLQDTLIQGSVWRCQLITEPGKKKKNICCRKQPDNDHIYPFYALQMTLTLNHVSLELWSVRLREG